MGLPLYLDFINQDAKIFLAMARALVAAFTSAEMGRMKLLALDYGLLCGGFK